ncbi:alpha/beta fold hydrolase [Aliiroseovarius sp. PrR006]|uniref:alpha/beta fold hydrolase n=1 Tax=Aliiroseovarius sp. PrR006 TaxID=2706883 RepID=UPI00351A3824
MTIPVLLLHGWTMRGAVFDDVAQRLGADFTCLAPDLPGHGEQREGDLSLDACAALVGRCVDRLDQPILVGWSMGAGAAWRYISTHGTSGLRGLVTIDMSPRMLPDTDWDLGLAGQNAEAILAASGKIEPYWPRVSESISRNMFAQGSDPTLSRSAVRGFLSAQDPAILRPLWDDLVAMDERETIAKIDIPYLVCFGAQSQLYTHRVADWIAAQAGNAQLQCFEHSGHSPHLEEPDSFCDAIRSFVAAQGLETSRFEPERT